MGPLIFFVLCVYLVEEVHSVKESGIQINVIFFLIFRQGDSF